MTSHKKSPVLTKTESNKRKKLQGSVKRYAKAYDKCLKKQLSININNSKKSSKQFISPKRKGVMKKTNSKKLNPWLQFVKTQSKTDTYVNMKPGSRMRKIGSAYRKVKKSPQKVMKKSSPVKRPIVKRRKIVKKSPVKKSPIKKSPIKKSPTKKSPIRK
jgi:hypothetical protein